MKRTKFLISLILLISGSSLFAQTSRPVVSDINTVPGPASTIKITWTLPENPDPAIKECYIFKDTKQIASFDDLSKLEPTGKADSSSTHFIDTITDTRDYYYCVLCNTENGVYNIILPSVNTTVNGAHIVTFNSTEDQVITPENSESKKQNKFSDSSEKMRDIPLPTPGFIEITKSPQNILGSRAMKTADDLGRKYTGTRNKITKPYVFEDDLICPENGDEYYLFKILKNSFAKKDYKKAVTDINDFLSIRRKDEVTKRAVFYLGESLYFTKNYEKAVFQFLKVQNEYPELSKKWIDSCLDLIEIK